MPQPSPEEQDALEEAIDRQLYRINRTTKAMFGSELSDDELRRAHGRIKQGVAQAQRQKPPPKMVTINGQQVPEYAVESGFINDQSGQATEQIRRGMR